MTVRQKHMSQRRSSIVFGVSVLILLLVSLVWRIRILELYSPGYDEGIHLILAKLYVAGYEPYKEIFISYPPFFLWSLGIPMQIFGQAEALQLTMVGYTLVGVLGVVYLGRVYGSRLAGIMAGIFLSFAPDYFVASVQVMGELPSVGMGVGAIALTEKYRRTGRWPWLILSSATLAIGLSLKVLPVFTVPLIALMVFERHITRTGWRLSRELWRDSVIAAGTFLLVFVLPFLLFDPASIYNQVIGMRLDSRETPNPFSFNNADIIDFIFGYFGITVLAIYGLAFVVFRDFRQYWLLLTWLVLVWISMYLHTPLRGKHLPVFLPPMAVLAGLAVDQIIAFVRTTVKTRSMSLRTVTLGLIIGVIAIMLWIDIPLIFATNSGTSYTPEINEERARAIELIDQISTPADCVVADNPAFLYQTNRLPPPQLSETSQTRIDTGYLTKEGITRAIEANQCHVVAVVSPRFEESVPGLAAWLQQHYLALYAQDETFVFFALKNTTEEYTGVTNGDFPNIIRLRGFKQEPQGSHLSLYWELLSPLTQIYQVKASFQSVTEPSNKYYLERPLFAGKLATGHWQPGEVAKDTFNLSVPPGTYDIHISVCAPKSDDCLETGDNTSGENAVIIPGITVP